MSKFQSFVKGDPNFGFFFFRNHSNKNEGGVEGGQDPILRESQKIDLLGFAIWHYGTKCSKNFQQFSNHFSIFIIHAKVDPTQGS